MKAIILSGGNGSRLYPSTKAISKQILPVYDKPMLYYSLSVLMLAEIREILLICTEKDYPLFYSLLGNGSNYGLEISYTIQNEARGIAEAFLIGEKFLAGDSCALILGDNFFYGHGLTGLLEEAKRKDKGAVIFPYYFPNPKEFGVVCFDEKNQILSIEEKPLDSKSNYIIPGLYFFDSTVIEKAKRVKPSPRGELEIMDVLQQYLEEKMLYAVNLGRGMAWFDMGTPDALLDSANFIRTVQNQQGTIIACLEEIAYYNGWISKDKLQEIQKSLEKTKYGKYLLTLF